LVCNIKATTFAPALREKHGCQVKQNERNYFSRKFGRMKKSITFAAALREKL